VTVVSPALTAGLDALVAARRIRHQARGYRSGDVAGFELAFTAVGPEVDARVAADGRRHRTWVNAADDPEHCDFILPSILRRGRLTVAVATGGASPALSRAVREELEAYLTEDYAVLADVAADVRRQLHARDRRPDAEAWRAALDAERRRLLAGGRREDARRHLLERLEGRP
jgi:siroheme synthase-like protein